MRIKLWTAAIVSATALLMGAAVPSSAQNLSDLDGNAFLGNPSTNQFLGEVSSKRLDNASICNRYGTHGSKIEELSLPACFKV